MNVPLPTSARTVGEGSPPVAGRSLHDCERRHSRGIGAQNARTEGNPRRSWPAQEQGALLLAKSPLRTDHHRKYRPFSMGGARIYVEVRTQRRDRIAAWRVFV